MEYEHNCIGKIESIQPVVILKPNHGYGPVDDIKATTLHMANCGKNPFSVVFYGDVPVTYQGQVVSLNFIVEEDPDGRPVVKQEIRADADGLEPILAQKTVGSYRQLKLIE